MSELEAVTEPGPDISILMTAYNAEAYLDEAIKSILEQETTRTWELLFVDDGSTDDSLEIGRKYAALHPNRISVFTHPGGANRGISASRNLAMRHARGALLAFLDSDDVWLPHHLETQARLLDTMPHLAMAYAAAERWVNLDEPFNEAESRRADWGHNYIPPLVPKGEMSGLLPRGKLLEWFRADESMVPCICTVVMRTQVARSVGGFYDAFRGLYDDQAFHAKVIMQHDVYANDVCVARYRQHAASCCGHSRREPIIAQKERQKFETFLNAHIRTVRTSLSFSTANSGLDE